MAKQGTGSGADEKKIYNLVEDVSFESGGLRTAVVNLHHYINDTADGLSSVILTNKKEAVDPFPEFMPGRFWNYSAELTTYLEARLNDISLFHLHGAWMHTQHTGSRIALKNEIPYLITLHGMIEPWYLQQKQLKKKIYRELLLNGILKNANAIHAITPSEKDNLFKLTGHRNIVEIPNFIHYTKIPQTPQYSPAEEEYLLFLSRLHPGKGLNILIQAMARIEDKSIRLKIVGTENDYSDTLKKEIRNLGLDNRIQFTGSIFGDEKFKLFSNAKAFVAPSYSEAIGMVNLEAAVCRTPVVTTFNTGINPEWSQNGGIMIHPHAATLTTAMNQAVSWTTAERIERGNSLRNYVIHNYSWENKGKLWTELYRTLL